MIKENVRGILESLSDNVVLVAATKTRTVEEIKEAIAGGIAVIGENYVQEAERKHDALGGIVPFHLVGHLQKNKVKKAVRIFDMIQTLDSGELAMLVNRECEKIKKVMPVLIEVNSAEEAQKSGISPDQVDIFLSSIIELPHIRIEGLMTMGPFSQDEEAIRSAFKRTKQLFDHIGARYPQLSHWQYLSMGMSDSYRIALACGANMVRIGSSLFGVRERNN